MTKKMLHVTVNGVSREVAVEPNRTLVEFLREDLNLTGTKQGCGEGDCGACTVLLDGDIVNACLVLALQTAGREVMTIEGLAEGTELHPIQQSFIEQGAIQCGYCSPGMILSAKALLDRNPAPSEEEIRTQISGNLCRCTGYQKIVEAIADAAKRLQAGSKKAKGQKKDA
jgi:aerobic carbon-monoxide dehydrogenase small subunit